MGHTQHTPAHPTEVRTAGLAPRLPVAGAELGDPVELHHRHTYHVAHNPFYQDVEIDVDALLALPADDPLQGLLFVEDDGDEVLAGEDADADAAPPLHTSNRPQLGLNDVRYDVFRKVLHLPKQAFCVPAWLVRFCQRYCWTEARRTSTVCSTVVNSTLARWALASPTPSVSAAC